MYTPDRVLKKARDFFAPYVPPEDAAADAAACDELDVANCAHRSQAVMIDEGLHRAGIVASRRRTSQGWSVSVRHDDFDRALESVRKTEAGLRYRRASEPTLVSGRLFGGVAGLTFGILFLGGVPHKAEYIGLLFLATVTFSLLGWQLDRIRWATRIGEGDRFTLLDVLIASSWICGLLGLGMFLGG